ncbi:MAG: hypothetical protein ACRCWI_00045 [Brevinema sp.]
MSYQNNPFPIILERFAMSYPRQAKFSYELMPLYEAEIARESYQVAQLGADHLQLEDFKRAYGSQAKRVQNNIQHWLTIPVHRYTIESSVDRAELVDASDMIQSSLLTREARMRNSYDKMMNSIEAEQVQSILDSRQYGEHTISPKDSELWNNESSTPLKQIELARQKIKNSIGVYPNKCIISDPVWQILRYKKNLTNLLPNTSLKSGITPEEFAKIIAVDKVIIADNMHLQDDILQYTWGNNVVLAYVPEQLYSLEELSFGITVRAPLGYENMRDYFDDRTTSDVTAVDERLGWSVINYQAGFLFKDVLS